MAEQTSSRYSSVTQEPLTVPVDYNDPTAVDPSSRITFCTQAAITKYLSKKGATSFKHLDRIWRALPTVITKNVVINMAAGIHRPSGDSVNTSSACDLKSKHMVISLYSTDSSTIRINGALPSSYLPIIGSSGSPLSITSYDDGVASLNPSLTFTGTPFSGLDLRGRFVVLNTGQATIIHDHDDSVLYTTGAISPAPATCWVGRQSTIYRNSLTDLGPVKSGSISVTLTDTSRLALQDIAIEGCGGNGIILSANNCTLSPLRVVIDDRDVYESLAIPPNGRAFQGSGKTTTVSLNTCCYLGVPGVGGNDGVLYMSGMKTTTLRDSYFKGGDYGLILSDLDLVSIWNTVLDRNAGGSIPALLVTNVGMLNVTTLGAGGKMNEIRGAIDTAGMLISNAHMPEDSSPGWNYTVTMMFKNCTVPCIVLNNGASINTTYSPSGQGLIDGGGNTSYGVQFSGGQSSLVMNASSNITGALGDVYMAGAVRSHTDIKNNGPFYDLAGNMVSHA
jgi:hypothetical protein